MTLTNGKNYYTVTTDAQIDALKACGFTEGEPPETEPPETKKAKRDIDRI